jgi:hypothetical protein
MISRYFLFAVFRMLRHRLRLFASGTEVHRFSTGPVANTKLSRNVDPEWMFDTTEVPYFYPSR